MFQTTRRRLAIWYSAVTAVLLLLFAIGVYLYVRNTLIERVDDTLNHVVEVVERSLVIEPNEPTEPSKYHVNIEASFRDNADTVEDDHIDLEWFSSTGELLWSTFKEPLNIPIHTNRMGETVQVLRGRVEERGKTLLSFDSPLLLRQVTERVQIGRQVLGFLRVSHPWFEVTKPSHQLMIDLGLGTVAMVSCVAIIGWLLSALAMEPVRQSYQSLKQFTADASHELRSPIAMIQTNVQVALADPDPQLHRQQLQVVERLTQRLGRLVDDLLFLARQDSGIVQQRWGSVPLDALLMEAIEEQRLVAQTKNITLSLNLVEPTSNNNSEIGEDFFTLLGDWDQLARLFTNLVGNALQYTPAGGQVEVELRQVGRHNNSHLQVKVKDTGVGISEAALPHIFDRFYRVDPARSRDQVTGSGLGLAIAQAIVKNHQGQIRAESILNQGTTFIVNLPQV